MSGGGGLGCRPPLRGAASVEDGGAVGFAPAGGKEDEACAMAVAGVKESLGGSEKETVFCCAVSVLESGDSWFH